MMAWKLARLPAASIMLLRSRQPFGHDIVGGVPVQVTTDLPGAQGTMERLAGSVLGTRLSRVKTESPAQAVGSV